MLSARKIGNIALYPLVLVTVSSLKFVCVWIISTYLWSTNSGLLNVLVLNKVVYICLGFFILDLSMYLQHRLLHASSFLWGTHSLHHSDTELDVTTYFRHHPFELLFGIIVTYLTVVIFGITPYVLASYFVINNIFQLVQHSNIKIPERVNTLLSYLLVTPSFHAIHHSRVRGEADSNYSTILSVWDRLFGTYTRSDKAPQSFGVVGFESERYQGIDAMLAMPFLIWWKQFKERK